VKLGMIPAMIRKHVLCGAFRRFAFHPRLKPWATAFVFALLAAIPTSATITVNGNARQLSGAGPNGVYTMTFTLQGCSTNDPRVVGTGLGVDKTFPVTMDALTGAFSTASYGNNEIDCAGQTDVTWWTVSIQKKGQASATWSADYILNSSEGQPINLNTHARMTNPPLPVSGTATIDNYIDWKIISPPAAPGAGYMRSYFKSGGFLCQKDSAGNETCGLYSTIDQSGVALTQRPVLNFTSAFNCSDNAGAGRTDCDLAGTIAANTSGTAANVTGTVAVANGGTGAATAGAHRFFGNNTGSTAAPGFQSIGAADLPGSITSSTSGNAATATALAANAANCGANQYAAGVDASGAAEGCSQPSTSTLSDGGAVVKNNQANTYTAGSKQTFASSSTTAGMNFAGVSADPSVPATGDLWFNTTSGRPKIFDGSIVHALAFQDDVPVGALLSANNLSDVADVNLSRTHINAQIDLGWTSRTGTGTEGLGFSTAGAGIFLSDIVCWDGAKFSNCKPGTLINGVTTTPYAIASTDKGVILKASGSASSFTIIQGGTSFADTYFGVVIFNGNAKNGSNVTFTPTTSTVKRRCKSDHHSGTVVLDWGGEHHWKQLQRALRLHVARPFRRCAWRPTESCDGPEFCGWHRQGWHGIYRHNLQWQHACNRDGVRGTDERQLS
jgi:hypothetical protein